MSSPRFFIQPFERSQKGRVVAGQPIQIKSEVEARRMAQRVADKKIGAVLLRQDDEYSDVAYVASFGAVPEGVLEGV